MGRGFDPETLLALPLMANLATTCPEGPRNAPVWYIWEAGALWMPSTEVASSARRLARDPRCAVEIVRFEREAGILRHLGLRGRASIEPQDTGRFDRLLARYLGPDRARWNAWFVAQIARPDDPGSRFIRLAPETTFTNDVSYFLTGPDFAEG
jgi:hypothetical protein